MNEHDERCFIGARAVGMLSALAKCGNLDRTPTLKTMALGIEQEWMATFKPAPSPATELTDAGRRARDGTHACPHGESYGECNACDVAGDHAFDAAREDRIFGR